MKATRKIHPKSPSARLRAYRHSLGLSLRSAAAQLGATHPALHAWEGGETPSEPFRRAIETWTRGLVKALDWPLTEREQALLARTDAVVQGTPLGE